MSPAICSRKWRNCTHCPRAVILAYQLALASPHIIAEGVEVSKFPDLGDRYAVMGVPKTVIDELVHVEGAVPEGMLLERLREALRRRRRCPPIWRRGCSRAWPCPAPQRRASRDAISGIITRCGTSAR